MAAAVTGTQYYYHLHHIRRLRDKYLIDRMGPVGDAFTDSYYLISRHIHKIVLRSSILKDIITHMIVRPLGSIARILTKK